MFLYIILHRKQSVNIFECIHGVLYRNTKMKYSKMLIPVLAKYSRILGDAYFLPCIILLYFPNCLNAHIISIYQKYYITTMCVCSVAQLCLTLCNPMDCSPPNSSVHGIFQARILEWVAIYFWYIVLGRSKREVLSAYSTVTYPSPSFLTEPDSGFGQFLAAHTPYPRTEDWALPSPRCEASVN